MNLLLKLFSSLVLGTFGILLMTPIVVAQGENDVIIMGTSVWDNCNANIVCEKTSDVSYQCYSTDTTIVGLGGQVHQISVGKSTHAILGYSGCMRGERVYFGGGTQITYIDPDTFIYPFVGIIKIQV